MFYCTKTLKCLIIYFIEGIIGCIGKHQEGLSNRIMLPTEDNSAPTKIESDNLS